MKKLSLLVLIAIVCAVGALSFAGRDGEPTAAPEPAAPEARTTAPALPQDNLFFEEVGGNPGPNVCGADSAVSCADLPMPIDGTCSCPWTSTNEECVCTNGRRGVRWEINCSICGTGCCGAGCEANCHVAPGCWEPTYSVCVEGLPT